MTFDACIMATSFQCVRLFSTTRCLAKKPNITKPRVPGTERRLLDAVTVPIFRPDTRTPVEICVDESKAYQKKRRSELTEAYNAFRVRETFKMFNENKMVAICHILPMESRDFFNARIQVFNAGLQLKFSNNNWSRLAVEGTRLRNLEPYFTSTNAFILSPEPKLPELMALMKKIPDFQLLGALVEDRIMSKDMITAAAKLPPLDTLRGELCTILSASASKTSRLLGKHQQDLSTNLQQFIKQQGEGGGPEE